MVTYALVRCPVRATMLTMGLLDNAAKAHRAAKAGLVKEQESARQRIQVARDRVEETREALAVAIVSEANKGMTQVEIIRRTGYSREAVRTILRRGGVEPD